MTHLGVINGKLDKFARNLRRHDSVAFPPNHALRSGKILRWLGKARKETGLLEFCRRLRICWERPAEIPKRALCLSHHRPHYQ